MAHGRAGCDTCEALAIDRSKIHLRHLLKHGYAGGIYPARIEHSRAGTIPI
jgi:hypothetical protein